MIEAAETTRPAIGVRARLATGQLQSILIACGWLLLVAAWIGANPPFAGADEQWHYVRTLGVSGGQFVGQPAPESRLGANARQIAWTRQVTRIVTVPAGMAPASAACYIVVPTRPATCIDRQTPPVARTRQETAVGTYPPVPYLLPALAVKLADSPASALRLGRIASALLCGALLVVALALLFDGEPLSLLGALLAVTPMVLFTVSLLNGSGLEIAAGVCFVASLLRLTRAELAPPAAWLAAAVSGVLLALSRDASPLWVVLLVLPPLALGGRATVRRHRRAAFVSGGLVLAAIAANRAWEAAYGPHFQLGLANARNALGEALREWWHALTDLIGRFGYLEVHVPLGWTAAWFVLVAAALGLALRLGSRRERVVVASTAIAFAGVLPVAFWLVQWRHTGFDLQGRHLLPLLVAVPLVAGEVIWRRRGALAPRTVGRLFACAAAVTALVQFTAWWTDARRSAVGTKGPLFFLGHARWTPPGGWAPWVALAAAGALCVALAGVATLQRSFSRRRAA